MQFNTRYSIGDIVYMPHNNIRYVPIADCPVCKGTGVSMFNKNVKCSARIDLRHSCHNGKLCTWETSWEPVECRITYVYADVYEEGLYEEEYCVSGDNDINYSPNEFYTLEECEEECKKRNERDK